MIHGALAQRLAQLQLAACSYRLFFTPLSSTKLRVISNLPGNIYSLPVAGMLGRKCSDYAWLARGRGGDAGYQKLETISVPRLQ